MRIDFYHLTARPLEQVLPSICEKLLAGRERLLIVVGERQVELLDRQLWTYAPDSFLPHGCAGAPGEAEQPILVGSEVAATNGARNIALSDGEWRDAALVFERVFYFFDGATIDGARTAWKALKDREGAERHYWKQDENGRWVEGP